MSLRPELEGLVVPSKFYGIAAAARPVGFVGDADGELARLLSECDCGFTVPAGRGDLLADAILSLSRDPVWRQRRAICARALLEQRFSRASAHERWHHLLARIAEGAAAAP